MTKVSNDEGIDGVINEDRLGLDVIYVQAKRWQNTVGRKEIQSFVGALAGHRAHKGIFIATSDFAESARNYARSIPQKIILLDGDLLADLMIQHNIVDQDLDGFAIARTEHKHRATPPDARVGKDGSSMKLCWLAGRCLAAGWLIPKARRSNPR